MILTGLDVFLESPDVDGPLGLLTNVASLTCQGQTALRALSGTGLTIARLFAPEHGYLGAGAAGESIAHSTFNNVSVHSLYGPDSTVPVDAVSDLSAMLIDLQDVGVRWYTYLGTIRNVLQACAAASVPVLLFDRPNPLGGIVVEGPVADAGLISLLVPATIPVRFGLTVGEFASLLNREIGASLEIVAMRGWRRDMNYGDTGLLWAAPSPGIPSPITAHLYAGTCLLEGLNVSEGRGTSLPFEQIGAPFIDAELLADEMNALDLHGVQFIPAWFRPSWSKYANEICAGVRLIVTDARQYLGFQVGLYLVDVLRRLYPVAWLQTERGYWFDRLLGTTHIRESMEENHTVAEILGWCEIETQSFQADSSVYWLYD